MTTKGLLIEEAAQRINKGMKNRILLADHGLPIKAKVI
jgi:hypothetical protein